MKYYTKTGLLLATDSVRLVIGERGEYLEFEIDQIVWDNFHIPEDQKWRLSEKYQDQVFYDEYRSNDEENIKLYLQRKYVGYADYNPGMCYISPLFIKEKED